LVIVTVQMGGDAHIVKSQVSAEVWIPVKVVRVCHILLVFNKFIILSWNNAHPHST